MRAETLLKPYLDNKRNEDQTVYANISDLGKSMSKKTNPPVEDDDNITYAQLDLPKTSGPPPVFAKINRYVCFNLKKGHNGKSRMTPLL